MLYGQAQLAGVRNALASMGLYAQNLPAMLEEMRKATFAAPASNVQGFNAYNLEPLAKLLINVYTPFRNMLPRVPGKGTGPNWRAVTKIDTDRMPMGVPDGVRGPFLKHSTAEFTGRYAEIDAGSSSTFFAVLAAVGFDDLRARSGASSAASGPTASARPRPSRSRPARPRGASRRRRPTTSASWPLRPTATASR